MRYLVAVLFAFTSFISAKSDILSTENQADYIVIYHPELQEAALDYFSWRQKNGVNISLISIDEIYQNFGNDTVSYNKAIRYFISFALSFWEKPAPKYVLLMGSTNHIPSFREPSYFSIIPNLNEDTISVDHYYSVNSHHTDEIPDIALGRLPGRNLEEIKIMIDKIKFYEDISHQDKFLVDIMSVVDSQDSSSFEEISESILINHIPKGVNISRAYFSDDSPYHVEKDEFHRMLSKPIKFLNYLGHGHPKYWSQERILEVNHVDTLNFPDIPFIMIALACSQNFDDKYDKGLAEKLLALENGGAIAAIGSSGINYSAIVSTFGRDFYSQLFTDYEDRIGDIFVETKKKHPTGFFKRFTLLGDPYLKINNNIIANINSNSRSDNDDLYFAHPNPFSNRTKIDIELSTTSNLKMSIYDFSGKAIDEIFNGLLYKGSHSFEWQANNLKSGIYFCKIDTDHNSKVIPLVLEK